ncbi:MAG: hypothetical protein ABJD07_00445 [Gemmatimonadaceae bacterium]
MRRRVIVRALAATAAMMALAATASPAQQPRAAAPPPPAVPVARGWPDTAWRHLGPASFGGRVDDIEAVEDDPRIIFVGTASGGIFRSRNNGVTWDAVFDAYGTALSIGDIAIAPSDRNVVWAGTGEPNGRQSSTWGDGVYRSLDGGTTWKNMGLRETQSIGRVVIDPRDPNTVFVAAVGHLWGPNEERGLYRTRDGGATWRKVLGVDDNTGVIDVAMARDGRTMFAATYMRRRRAWGFSGGGPTSGLWRSLDGGDTWERVSSGLPAGNIGRIGIDIARSDPNIVYIVLESRAGGVFRSADRGATWTRQSRLDERPSYFSQIRVDPKNPDRVWLLGTYLYLSIDGGKTFTSDSLGRRLHPDHHALWIDPSQPDHMMLGNDGGVFFTYDAARSWNYIDNLPIGQFYDITIDARDPYWIYGGLQDLGTFGFPSGTHSRGRLFDDQVTFLEYGDGFQTAADPTNPRLLYANSQNGRGYVVDIETHEERRITPVAAERTERYRFNWNTAILVSPVDPRVYYYGANKLLKTADHGTTWQVISPDLTRNLDWRTLSLGPGIPDRDSTTLSRDDGTSAYGNITTIAESPRAAGTLYVGTDDGTVQMTTDSGAHWTNLTARFHLAGAPSVAKVVASRHDAKTAFVVFDGHTNDDQKPYVFKTADGGATWSAIAGDLPATAPLKTLTEDPRNPNLLFAGTEFGLYWSFDGGRHWSFPGGNLPRVIVTRAIVNERNNDLILGTHGRSVLVLDDIRSLETGDPARAEGAAQLFPLRDATEYYQWRDQPLTAAGKFSAPNAPVGALVTYSLRDSAETARIQILAADGSVVRELAAPGSAGVHRIVWNLRMGLAFVPAPSDSGFYGAPLAPLVPPGSYTVRLIAHGATATQPLTVRANPRAEPSAESLAARQGIAKRVDSLARVYADGKRLLASVDTEFAHLRPLLARRPPSPATDSVVKGVASQIATLRRAFAPDYGAPIGEVFDVIGGLTSNAYPPTQAELRTLDFAAADLASSVATLNTLVGTDLPKLRAALGRP